MINKSTLAVIFATKQGATQPYEFFFDTFRQATTSSKNPRSSCRRIKAILQPLFAKIFITNRKENGSYNEEMPFSLTDN